MIKDPSLILTFTANDLEAGHESVQTITGEDLLTRSISIEHRLLDGLKPSSDKAEISIRKGAPVTEDIIRTEGDIHAVLMDGTETLFTGYVSTNFSWSVTDYGEETLSITIEDVGTRLLEKSFITEGFHLFQCEAYRAVEAIAGELHVSREHLSRVFTAQTGISPGAFATQERMHLAGRLLRDRNLNCKDIAIRLGFESASSFTRAFRAHYKVSPTQYLNS